LAKKDVGNACSNYEQAILFDPMCREAYIKYARAYKGVNPQLSIEKLGQLKEKDPSFLLVDKELADIYYTMNKFDEAVKHYEIYLQSGNSNTQDKTKYAMTLFLKQDYTKSLEVAKLGLEKAPRNPAFNRLAMYNNVALKNHTEGLKYADLLFNKSDKVDVNYFDYTYYGQALRETKQFDLAITQYKSAFKVDSTKIDLLKEIANMYYEKRDSLNGIASQEKYISLLAPEKRTGDVLFAIGKIYSGYATSINDSVNEKKEFVLVKDAKRDILIKADTVFSQLSRLEPTAYRADFWRARVNFAMDPQNSKDIAKGFYEKTLNLAESKADVKYNPVIIECARYLGFYYYMKSDFTQSKVYWTKIIAIDPNNVVANKALAGIEKPKGKK
jgi:tetratricopeptide (TPR) repeat protein